MFALMLNSVVVAVAVPIRYQCIFLGWSLLFSHQMANAFKAFFSACFQFNFGPVKV
jgi:hypothetical protein